MKTKPYPLFVLCCFVLIAFAGCDRIPGLARPAPTPRPTNVPTPTVPVSGLADVTLQLEDLPSGFRQLSSGETGLSNAPLFEGTSDTLNFGFVLEGEEPEIILGLVALIPDPVNQSAFDVIAQNDPETITSIFTESVPGDVISEEAMPGMDHIGDASVGSTVKYAAGGETWRMDITIFRKEKVIVFIATTYFERHLPQMPINALVRKLEDLAARVP